MLAAGGGFSEVCRVLISGGAKVEHRVPEPKNSIYVQCSFCLKMAAHKVRLHACGKTFRACAQGIFVCTNAPALTGTRAHAHTLHDSPTARARTSAPCATNSQPSRTRTTPVRLCLLAPVCARCRHVCASTFASQCIFAHGRLPPRRTRTRTRTRTIFLTCPSLAYGVWVLCLLLVS